MSADARGEKRHTRRPRRAVAAPTNPAADQADDVPSGSRRRSDRPVTAGATDDLPRLDPRDTWILEQRPPHWD